MKLNSPLKNRILFGTVQLGMNYGINNQDGKPSFAQSQGILERVRQAGFNGLESAEIYGDAHALIGKYHEVSEKFDISTKIDPTISITSKEILEQHICETIDKLNVDFLETYSFHDFQQYKNFKLWKELADFKRKGLIKNIGVSIYTNEEAQKVASNEHIDIVQLPFNLLDNNNLRGKMLALLKANGKEIHARSVFLQGLFFLPASEFPDKIIPLIHYIEEIHAISLSFQIALNQLAIGYVLYQPQIDKIILGIDNIEQLDLNVKALESLPNLSTQAFKKIDSSIFVRETSLLNPSIW